MRNHILKPGECRSAEAIQDRVNKVRTDGGGCIILPEMELVLDRGLQLFSNIELKGQGDQTVLRKAASRAYPMSGYHNYGMMDVPLVSSDGLKPGMTVSIHDSRSHGGFYETFATITWVENNWVGINRPIKADYARDQQPELTTAFPMIFAHDAENVTIKNLTLDGNLEENTVMMGGCRGGCIYFAGSRNMTVDSVRQHHYNKEGISFQMCADVFIRNSEFHDNAGNGMHPGAGSTNVVFDNCKGANNQYCGFFFCVRANHIDVRNCEFRGNGIGVSIGTRDCYNLIEDCRIADNQDVGLETRDCWEPAEVHSCMICNCEFRSNGVGKEAPEIRIGLDTHDVVFENNRIHPVSSERDAIVVHESAENICFENTVDSESDPPRHMRACAKPDFECGYSVDLDSKWFRHLSACL